MIITVGLIIIVIFFSFLFFIFIHKLTIKDC